MLSVLFLVHRIPYPPNKGDKIRSYHLLRYLSGRYRVFLGAFVDDPFDFQYKPVVDGLCQESLLIPIHSTRRKIASLGGLLTGEALSLPYYRNRQMQAWVDATIERESRSASPSSNHTSAWYTVFGVSPSNAIVAA